MFRPPYRWFYSWSTFWQNVSGCYYDLLYGIKNVFRWIPVIWFDRDWDWVFLAKIVEFKLRRMVKNAEHWHTVDAERNRKQMLVCAELLKRLQKDDYYEPTWVRAEQLVHSQQAHAKFAQKRTMYDSEYLGKVLGKYLLSWWD